MGLCAAPALAHAVIDRGPSPSLDPQTISEPAPVVGPCDSPVPDHVDIGTGRAAFHFYVPEPSWALAAAHVAIRTEQLAEDGIDLRISPSLVFATALQESYLGCSDDRRPDVRHAGALWPRVRAADLRGCFQIAEETAWKELCRLYPETIDCAAVDFDEAISARDQGRTRRDNFETGAFAFGQFATYAYALYGRHVRDVDQWFAKARDPFGMEKMLALSWNRGAWSKQVRSLLKGCREESLERCLDPESVERHHVVNVGRFLRAFDGAIAQGSCYAEPLSSLDVLEYLDALSTLLPNRVDLHVRDAVIAAYLDAGGGADPAPFQAVARPVLLALEAAWSIPLSCPDEELRRWYGFGCPMGGNEPSPADEQPAESSPAQVPP